MDLILKLLNSPKTDEGGEGPPNKVGRFGRWTPSTNFLFISSFSFQRVRISFSFFRLVSSFLLFISAISFCRNIKSVICSASDILLFIMLLVHTIYFPLHANSLDPTMGAIVLEQGWNQENDSGYSLVGRSAFPPFL